jgi:hypothetical protein
MEQELNIRAIEKPFSREIAIYMDSDIAIVDKKFAIKYHRISSKKKKIILIADGSMPIKVNKVDYSKIIEPDLQNEGVFVQRGFDVSNSVESFELGDLYKVEINRILTPEGLAAIFNIFSQNPIHAETIDGSTKFSELKQALAIINSSTKS